MTSCGFSSLYPLTNTAIASLQPGETYTIKLYKDNGTPTNLNDDTLLATYTDTLLAPPLLSTQLSGVFPTNGVANPGLIAAATASSVTSSTITWTAPSAAGMYASNVNI